MKGKFLGDTRSGKQKISEVRSPLPMSSLHSPCVTEAAVQSPLTPHGFGLSSAPVPLTGGSSKSLNRKNGTSTAWESVHAKQADNGHSDFVCDCKIARSRGQRSCLKQLNPEELMDCHRASFGVYVQHAQANVDVGPRALGIRIHRLMSAEPGHVRMRCAVQCMCCGGRFLSLSRSFSCVGEGVSI